MRSNRWIGAVLAAVAMVAVACGDDDDSPTVSGGGQSSDTTVPAPTFAAGTTMANLQSKGRIVVGVKFDQPGLGQKNPTTNQVEGFDVEIAKLIAVGIYGGSVNDIESKIEFREATTPNREIFIENGTVDMVVATYTINDARKQRIDFAGPYYVAGQDIMVKRDNNTIKGVNDLAGTKTCSVRNSTPAANIKRLVPTAELTEFDQYSDCVQALRDGRVQSVTTDNSILLGFVAGSPNEFKIVGNKFTEEPYGIGVRKGDDAFRNFINDRLEAIYASGEWARAFDATLGRLGIPVPAPPRVDRYTSGGAAATTSTSTGATTTTSTRPSTTTSTTRA
ncbi:MAG TPA: glutamate ABC transporter substrate-binding protein [Acidimicrobiales bacterium]|nr:glutamate ABC transporter substrate-binding protein [Acidimicrobiales bacterium]